eukprot:SAG31_NODE_1244_length_9137_cov_36.820978_6_plen_49_part_00
MDRTIAPNSREVQSFLYMVKMTLKRSHQRSWVGVRKGVTLTEGSEELM